MRRDVNTTIITVCMALFAIGGMCQGASKTGATSPQSARRPPLPAAKKKEQVFFNISNTPPILLSQELKLSDEQQMKCKTIKEAAEVQMRVISNEETSADRTAMRKRMYELRTKTITELEAVLDDSQKRMLPGFMKDLSNLQALHAPVEVFHDMKLTSEQKKKMFQLVYFESIERIKRMNALRDAQTSGDQSRVEKAIAAMLPVVCESFIAILSPAQKTVLGAYQTKRTPRQVQAGEIELTPGKP